MLEKRSGKAIDQDPQPFRAKTLQRRTYFKALRGHLTQSKETKLCDLSAQTQEP
jgi:hypothetical protein